MNPIDLIGWLGAFLILLAFWLLTHKVIHSHSKTYLGLNLIGAAALVFEGWIRTSYPALLLNAAWVAIAIYGLTHAHKRPEPKRTR
ncbi:hypothetical protein COV18_06025 [Candidatus Woesearchaeota archaeon CG10_big_fil_rev_8_21_14_0_10_37_12]|nr:MAG: hypothetical protein COV18_06025 [Candidatus Woesearchaeota archaeon CG10_big_fil_rev_8_21_14_0_10_37_12]